MILVWIALWLLGAASACSPVPTATLSPLPVLPTLTPLPSTRPPEVLDPTQSEIHIWHSLTGRREATLRTLAAAFAADNPHHIRVRVEYHSPLRQEVLTAIAAATPPDIVITPCDQLAGYATTGAVVPLTAYLDNEKYGLSLTQQSELWPVAIDGCRDEQSGEPLGLFFDVQANLMFYNATWLKKLKTDAPPQTWDEFRSLCNAARDKKTATWGFAFDGDGLTVVNSIAGLGGTLLNTRTGQFTLSSPQAIGALSVLSDLHKDGCSSCAYEPGVDRVEFGAEKLLLTFSSSAELANYSEAVFNTKTKKPRFAWGVAPMPHLASDPVVMVQGLTMGILRTSPNQQLAAWLFVEWFSEPQNDLRWSLETGALPLHRGAAEAPEMASYVEQNPQFKTASQMLVYARTEPAIKRWPDVRELLSLAAKAVCLGEAQPNDALLAANTAAEAILAR